METVTFFQDKFRVSKEEKELIELSYVKPYLWFTEQPVFHDTDVCCANLNNLLLYITTTHSLNLELISIQERIAKGLTPSKSNSYDWVEEGLIYKLIQWAEQNYMKEVGEYSGRINRYELDQFFKLPNSNRILKEIKEKHRAILKDLKEPTLKMEDISLYYSGEHSNDNFQCWGVNVESSYPSFRYGHEKKDLYRVLREEFNVNVGKIGVFTSYGDNPKPYLQLNVYDYANRDWAFRTALEYLITHGLKLSKVDK